ncbi:SusC/RagA family TonB-linked outer membrane protein [Lutibacter sp.]
MKKKFNGFLTLILVLLVQITFAQEKTISGTVSDETGPLPGVNVIVKGTNNGTQTDFDGKYTLKASTGDVLVFSYVGMETKEKTIGSSSTINVTMTGTNLLEEVVIVGYGTTTKKSYTGTASVVKNEDLETKSFSNISQSLAGEAAGVTVINTSGQPGTTSTIRIRGYGSVNGNREPLYVVDGVPFSGSINSINPSDIKSTTILKDATATAIYGSRGAAGVILITTKTGTSRESYVELDFRTGINTQLIPRYDVITSPEEYIGYVWEGIYNRGVINGEANPVGYANDNLFTSNYVHPGYNMWNVANGAELIDPNTRLVRDGVTRRYTPERYSDLAFDSAVRTEVNVRMGGGNEKSKHFFSLGYLNDDGYAINTSYKRYTTRLNLTSDIKKWLNVGANIGYAYSESLNNGQTVGSENLFEFADKMAPIFPVFLRDDNYQLVPDPIFGGNQYDYGSDSGFRARPNANNLNPIASALYDYNGTKRHELNGNFSLNIDIIKNLKFETRYGVQYFINKRNDFRNPFYGGGRSNGGDLFTDDDEVLIQNFLQLLRYKNSFGDHSIEVLAAHESNEYEFNNRTAYKGLAVHPNIYELDNFVENLSPATGYSEGSSIESYFSQVNYAYDDKYFFTGSVRTDGSSRFVNDKWGVFGSIGGAWVISNEDFFSDNTLFSFLKIKTSYGITGDQAGVGFYSGYDTFNLGNLGGISISPRDNGNPDLTWETSKMFQTGVEFSLGNYFDGSIDYYNKLTDNLIFDRRVGPSQGITVITVNDGVLSNNGLEFDFKAHLFKKEDFKLNISVNGEMIQNEIKTMPLEPSTGLPRIVDTSADPYAYSKGRSIFDFYMREWAGVDPADGSPMWFQYFNDANNNNVLDLGEDSIASLTEYLFDNPDANVKKQVTHTYSEATDKYVGKSGIPDLRGAFRLNATYKNFSFSTQFTYSLGGWAYDFQYAELMSDRFGAVGNNFSKDIINRWTQPGDITNVPRLSDAIDQNSTSTSTRFLTSTDYIALNNASIGYNVPKKFLSNTGISSLNIWFSGDNLFVTTARTGFNPSTREDGNSERRIYAPMTTFTAGVKVKF